ncbi:glycosyltransferase family 2 protein [Candidatus Nomurabacteria bacterium]|nr:glycosyltransferase family 2 protein [Candidatus Nomurabacteria bacterium]
MNKLVSIILPTYNGAVRISDAIKSVLNQSYTNWELLVIDDGSKDNTKEIVENFTKTDSRVKYIKNENNLGIQKTLNKGIREAKGEYIARIDDDDIWCDPQKLEKQVEFLDKNKDYVLVGTGVIVVDEGGKELFRYLVSVSDYDIRERLLGKNCFVHSSVVFRKAIVLEIGGYGEGSDVRHMEDYDLWLRIGLKGKFANLPMYSIKWCLRNGSLSSVNRIDIFKKIIYLIKSYKDFYPNYHWAVVRSYVRLFIYGFVLKLPIKMSLNKIIRLYKES